MSQTSPTQAMIDAALAQWLRCQSMAPEQMPVREVVRLMLIAALK